MTTTSGPRRLSGLRRWLALGLVASTAAAGLPALVPAAADPATSESPMSPGYTIVVQDEAELNGSEINGSLAVGGVLAYSSSPFLGAPADGSALPRWEGRASQLIVGDTVDFSKGGRFDVKQGSATVRNVDGLWVTGNQLAPSASYYPVLVASSVPGPLTLDDYTGEAFAQTYDASFFSRAASEGDRLGSLANTVEYSTSWGALDIRLQPGVLNVWNVDASVLKENWRATFADGVVPSADTPLVINPTGSRPDGGSLEGLRFEGGVGNTSVAPYITWNLTGWTTVELTGWVELSGLVLAPNATVTNNRSGTVYGQIVARNYTSNTWAPVSHYQHSASGLRGDSEVPVDEETSTLALGTSVQNGRAGTAVEADFTLTATASGAESQRFIGGQGDTPVPVKPGVYTLASAGPDGYAPTDLGCTDGETKVPVTDEGTIEVEAGREVRCAFINSYQHLEIAKQGWDVPSHAAGSLPDAATEIDEGDLVPDHRITWTYTVENTGATVIDGITVTDDKLPAEAVTCPDDTLEPGAQMICTASGTTG